MAGGNESKNIYLAVISRRFGTSSADAGIPGFATPALLFLDDQKFLLFKLSKMANEKIDEILFPIATI